MYGSNKHFEISAYTVMKYFVFQTSEREKFSLRAKFKLKPEKMLYNGFASCQIDSLRSSSLPTCSSRYLLTKSKTCTLGGASLKERELYKEIFFERLRKHFQWFTESIKYVANLLRTRT